MQRIHLTPRVVETLQIEASEKIKEELARHGYTEGSDITSDLLKALGVVAVGAIIQQLTWAGLVVVTDEPQSPNHQADPRLRDPFVEGFAESHTPLRDVLRERARSNPPMLEE